MRTFAIGIISALIVIAVICSTVYFAFRAGSPAPLSAGLPVVAIVVFFALASINRSVNSPWQLTEETMRTALAGTLIIEYAVLVGTVAFFTAGNQIPPLT